MDQIGETESQYSQSSQQQQNELEHSQYYSQPNSQSKLVCSYCFACLLQTDQEIEMQLCIKCVIKLGKLYLILKKYMTKRKIQTTILNKEDSFFQFYTKIFPSKVFEVVRIRAFMKEFFDQAKLLIKCTNCKENIKCFELLGFFDIYTILVTELCIDCHTQESKKIEMFIKDDFNN